MALPAGVITKSPKLFEYNSKYRMKGENIANYSARVLPSSGTVRLVDVHIPLSHDTINDTNNVISFMELESNVPVKTTLPKGNHSIGALRMYLIQAMNLVGCQQYRVSEFDNILTIEAKDNFRLVWDDNTIWEHIGFFPQEGSSNKWVTESAPLLSPSGRYYLDVGVLVNRKIYGGCVSATFPLTLKGNYYEIAQWQSSELSPVLITPRCSQINIKLLDSDGRVVQLKRDWFFVLENIPTSHDDN